MLVLNKTDKESDPSTRYLDRVGIALLILIAVTI